MKYSQELPKEVEQKLDAYIERIKKIKSGCRLGCRSGCRGNSRPRHNRI